MPLRGDRLRRLREQLNLSREELADQINVHSRNLARYENNEVDPAGDIVRRIAEKLQTSTDYLLGISDDVVPQMSEDDLSPMERLLVDAYRRGDLRELMRIASENPEPQG